MKQWRSWVLPLWSVVLALVMLGPALGRGYVLSFDMVWVPDLALRPDFLGVATGLPRAVPSDAVVALLDEVVPGMLLQKVVLLGSLVAGGLGAARLVPSASLVARALAVGLFQWNPLIVERLVLGHWPVLLGYAVLPWCLVAAQESRRTARFPRRLLWLVPLGSLSAGAGLVTALVVLAFAAGGARTARALLVVLAANAPWLVAGLLHASSSVTDVAGAGAFALRDEGLLPGPLAALGLGGAWNAETMPSSREGVLAVVGLVVVLALSAIGARPWWRRVGARDGAAFLVCAVTGWALAVLTWAAPGVVGWLVEQVPGAGLVRDGARLLALLAPLLVVTAASGVDVLLARVPSGLVPRLAVAVAVVLAPVAVLPDAAWGATSRLGAAPYPPSYDEARDAVSSAVGEQPGDVLVLPLSSYRQPAFNGGRKVLDPVGRYLTPDYVASDELVVSGAVIAGEDPRVREARTALDAATPQERAELLGELGISVVVVDVTAPGPAPLVDGAQVLTTSDLVVVVLPDATVRDVPTAWVVAMAGAWTAFGGLLVGALVAGLGRLRLARSRRQITI
ncbi:hypothetical protein [Nocardioides sp.]|uniref:hypothetical protein n=1 Tax=Nocardioides sp. TaxID=35761 RepID=UPI00286CD57B|nr:hypothetical protein [Nocardioides sp.]